MFPFHHTSIRLCLTRLDLLTLAVGVIQLQTIRFALKHDFLHTQILQRNDAAWLFVRSKFKIIQAVIGQDKPASLPRLHTAAQFEQPALAVRVEEGVRQIVPIILWDFEGFGAYAVVQIRQKVVGQILAVVDPAVHADESLERGLVLHVRIVQTCVQHDDGKRQDITRV